MEGRNPVTDYAELRHLAENATPGTREAHQRFGVTVVPGLIAATHIRYPVKDRTTNGYEGETRHDLTMLFVGADADAEFIAAANPTVILALLDELQALRVGCDEMEARHSAELDAAMSAGWDECADVVAEEGLSDYATDLRARNPYWKADE